MAPRKKKKKQNRKSNPAQRQATLAYSAGEGLAPKRDENQHSQQEEEGKGEVFLKDKNANMEKSPKKSLRFMKGDDVVFRRPDDDSWQAGTVIELWHRHAKWEEESP